MGHVIDTVISTEFLHHTVGCGVGGGTYSLLLLSALESDVLCWVLHFLSSFLSLIVCFGGGSVVWLPVSISYPTYTDSLGPKYTGL